MSNDEFEKSLSDLSDKELIEILDKGNMSQDELEILIKAMESKGMSGRIMEVSGDPSDEQGMQIMEYLDYHKKLPEFNNDLAEDKAVNEAIKTLKIRSGKIENKKMAIMILAHSGRLDALNPLEKFAKSVPPELMGWTQTAIGECQMFLETKLSDKPKVRIKKLPKIKK